MDVKTKRILIILLAVSFSINLLFVGFIVGKSMNKSRHHGREFKPHDLPRLGWIMRELPDEQKEKIRPLIKRQRENRREKLHIVRELRKKTHEILVAETFNKEEFEKTLNELRQSAMKEQQLLINSLATISENLPQEERIRLSKILDKGRRHRRRNHEHRRPHN